MSGNNHLIRDEGDTVRITVNFFNTSGVLANPTTVTYAQRTPAQAESANTATTSGITNSATGIYYKDVLLSSAGLWRFEFRGVGNSVDQIERYSIDVIRSELRI